MRLVCPNCEAKYEVPDDAIPDIGRDVQCANCGHSWFQMRPRPASAVADPGPAAAVEQAPSEPVSAAAAEIEPEAPAAEPDAAEAVALAETAVVDAIVVEASAADADVAPTEPDTTAEAMVAEVTPETAPEPFDDPAPLAAADSPAPAPANDEAVILHEASAPEPEPDAILATDTGGPSKADAVLEADPAPVADSEADPEAEADTAPTQAAAAAAAYAVDESVLAILREEAEREAQARRAEARPLESQTDLGLDAAMPGRSKPALVSANGATLDSDGDAALKPSARRDLLPDVEEINSTLRPSEVPSEDFAQSGMPQREAKGFRSGFLMVMTVAIIGAAIYTAAPRLGVMVPALAGVLEAYVGAIDSLRLSLDGIMQSATVAINGG